MVQQLSRRALKNFFGRAAAKLKDASANELIDTILSKREDLRGQTAYVPGNGFLSNLIGARGHHQGSNSVTVFIGDEAFKKTSGWMKGFRREIAQIKSLEGSGLPMPKVTCVYEEEGIYGMKRLPGVQLPDNFLNTFKPKEITQLAEDLAGLIARLANFVPKRDGRSAFLTDLQPRNILIDRKTRRLTGVVDSQYGFDWYPLTKFTQNTRPSRRRKVDFDAMIRNDERVTRAFGPPPAQPPKTPRL